MAGAGAPWMVISTLLIRPRRVKLVTACPSVRPSAGMNRMAMSAGNPTGTSLSVSAGRSASHSLTAWRITSALAASGERML